MSLSGSYQVSVTALGITVAGNVAKTATTGIDPVDATLAVGKAGTLDNVYANAADVVLTAGHGLTTGTYDVHWADDGTGQPGCRYNMTGTVTGDTMAIDGGAGDSLPADDTAVVVQAPTTYDQTFDGDNLVLIGAGSTRQSQIVFWDSDDAVLLAVFLSAGNAWGWAKNTGTTTPITGNAVAYTTVSNGSASNTNNIKITGLQYAA
jgi:hypothetical protein